MVGQIEFKRETTTRDFIFTIYDRVVKIARRAERSLPLSPSIVSEGCESEGEQAFVRAQYDIRMDGIANCETRSIAHRQTPSHA